MTLIQEIGNKWSEISKKMKQNRTEHMIKNRYHSLIKKYQNNKEKASNKAIEKKIIRILEIKIKRY